ncbi:MAG TPA: ABC transporter ATP-binding protein [Anaerolineales bacterium]|nr:ABC transporter ATP-binding protein [Anaerolineales bacterium]
MFGRRRRIGRSYEQGDERPKVRISREELGIYTRLLGYVRPYMKWMVISIIALLFSVGLGLILPLVIRNLVDLILVDNDLPQLNRLAIGLFVVFILQSIASFIHRLSLAYVGENAVVDIRVQVYSHLQDLSLRFFGDNRTGEIVSRITNDTALLQSAITDDLVALLRQVITLVGAAVLLFWLDWRLTLIILLGVPFITLTMVWLGRKIRRESEAVQDALAKSASVVEETVAGVRIVKSFARERYEIDRFSSAVDEIYTAAIRRAKIGAVLGPIIGFMAFASITITLWFGAYEVIQGRLTAGDLVAYLIYTMMVAAPIASLAGLYASFQGAIGATEHLFDLLDEKPDIVSKPGAVILPPLTGEVRFEQVSFTYSEDIPVLREVSFLAQPGQVIALVGPSGAGKSTLISLIPRFWDADAGVVTIDGYDIREVDLPSLREQIGIVPQETILFSDSVFANIQYGKLDATREEVEAAAKAANAHEFILNDLPGGYETEVGERGVKLSGGQRQRVAIARAILKNPRILILDEATSSLDSESEGLVQEALEHLMQSRTSFVIAHRLSTIVNADWVLVLNEGRLVEQGTHLTLLEEPDGLYARLYEMQFGAAEGEGISMLVDKR